MFKNSNQDVEDFFMIHNMHPNISACLLSSGKTKINRFSFCLSGNFEFIVYCMFILCSPYLLIFMKDANKQFIKEKGEIKHLIQKVCMNVNSANHYSK